MAKKEKSKKPKETLSGEDKVMHWVKRLAYIFGFVLLFLGILGIGILYQNRWSSQQELARVTGAVEANKTYTGQPVQTAQAISSELRSAAISDGLTSAERKQLLSPHYDTLSTFHNESVATLQIEVVRAYNQPMLTLNYSKVDYIPNVQSAEPKVSSPEPATTASVVEPAPPSEPEVTESEDTTSEIDTSSPDDVAADAEVSTSEVSELPASTAELIPPTDIYDYVPPDIGLNQEFSTPLPLETSYAPHKLIALAQQIVTEGQIQVVRILLASGGTKQLCYITPTGVFQYDIPDTQDFPTVQGTESITGFKETELEGIRILSGSISADLNLSDAVDVYLAATQQAAVEQSPTLVVLVYKGAHNFYFSPIAKLCSFTDSLDNLSDRQRTYRQLQFFLETQELSNAFYTTLYAPYEVLSSTFS